MVALRTTEDELTDRLLHTRTIRLSTTVDDESAALLCAQLHLLDAEGTDDIRLLINSPGGSVTAGLAIYDTMQFIEADVATIATGLAASMAQILLCAGATAKRFALPNASIMMHQGSAGIGGTASDVAIQARQLEATTTRVNELLARHTGQPIERIRSDSDRDHWLTAEEARTYGMVDYVIARRAELDALLAGEQPDVPKALR